MVKMLIMGLNTKLNKISVVIPMYNAEKTIISAIFSVINQTKPVHEIIIVNDGSTDHSRKIVEDYISNYSQSTIKLMNKENGGVSSARNLGMKTATGNWIALLDSDDEWLPNKLERQHEIIDQNPFIDFLGTTRNGEFISRILWKKLNILTRITSKNLLIRFVFVVPTIIFRREIINEVGYFDESQKYAEEGNYFIRIANKKKCYLLNESLVITGNGKAHFGESGLSGNILEMEKGELKNIKDSYKQNIINYPEYIFLCCFSILKFVRRWSIVKLR